MPKHKQTDSLGKLTNYTTSPEQPPISAEAEIEALKKRVATLELLLNDVMHQLDKPTKQAPKRKQTQQKPPKAKQKPEQEPPKEVTDGADAMLEAVRENPNSLRSELADILGIPPKLAGQQLHFLLGKHKIKMSKREEDGEIRTRFNIK